MESTGQHDRAIQSTHSLTIRKLITLPAVVVAGQVTIKSCRSELPVETLEKAVRKGFPHEQTRRVLLMMKRMGLLG